MDLPGLDRWGRDQDDAMQKLASSLPRYAAVVCRVRGARCATTSAMTSPVRDMAKDRRRRLVGASLETTRLPPLGMGRCDYPRAGVRALASTASTEATMVAAA